MLLLVLWECDSCLSMKDTDTEHCSCLQTETSCVEEVSSFIVDEFNSEIKTT